MVSKSRGGGYIRLVRKHNMHNMSAFSICRDQSNVKISIKGRINFRIIPPSVYITICNNLRQIIYQQRYTTNDLRSGDRLSIIYLCGYASVDSRTASKIMVHYA